MDQSYKSNTKQIHTKQDKTAQYKGKLINTTKIKLQKKTMKHLFSRGGDDEIVRPLC